MDLATLLGLIAAFGLVVGGMVLGGAPGAYLDAPSLLIVLGGTVAITIIGFSPSDLRQSQAVLFRALFRRVEDPTAAAAKALHLAGQARSDGVLSLDGKLRAATIDGQPLSPFFQRALGLVVDGMPESQIATLLNREVEAMNARHAKAAGILRRAAEVAPAMGLIGTLVGLVQMLGALDDPSRIGPAMAIALITTLYGAMLANMVFAPLANKLERNSEEEALVSSVYLTAAASISRLENPRHLATMLNAVLPPDRRLRHME
jgi:chemotaxis protein MotA